MTKEEPSSEADETGERSKRLETFFLMASKDISDPSIATEIIELLTTQIDHAIVDFRIISSPDTDTSSAAFVQSLHECHNLLISGSE